MSDNKKINEYKKDTNNIITEENIVNFVNFASGAIVIDEAVEQLYCVLILCTTLSLSHSLTLSHSLSHFPTKCLGVIRKFTFSGKKVNSSLALTVPGLGQIFTLNFK